MASVRVIHGDCFDVMRQMEANSVDAVVTDPPYGLEFMGKDWDRPWQARAGKPASAGMSKGGFEVGNGYTNRQTPSYGKAWKNKRCQKCGHIASGGSPCHCVEPEWVIEQGNTAAPMQAYQAWCEEWTTECLRILKPGGHLLAFGGTRTYHRLTCAIEDAGFEIRDSLMWLYGSGFPKSLDVSKAIDKAAGAERAVLGTEDRRGVYDQAARTSEAVNTNWREREGRKDVRDVATRILTAPATPKAEQWQGWGTALKPAYEPIVVARSPLACTVAANVLAHGTGALNIDGCRTPTADSLGGGAENNPPPKGEGWDRPWRHDADAVAAHSARIRENVQKAEQLGRWPANVVLDEEAALALDEQSGERAAGYRTKSSKPDVSDSVAYGMPGERGERGYKDRGGASRFFYTAKASRTERGEGNVHPTVKPLALMRWLVRLVTPPGGVILDPFAGSGTTLIAAVEEDFDAIGIELQPDYVDLIHARLERTQSRLPLEESEAAP